MWRRDQTAAAQNCAEYKIAHCFPTREELCSSPEVDVVFITSPDAMHRDDTLLALRHGKAVLCEKPVAMNAAEAEEMAGRARRLAALRRGAELSFQPESGVDAGADRRGTHRQSAACSCAVCYPAAQAPRSGLCRSVAGLRGAHCRRWRALHRCSAVMCWARKCRASVRWPGRTRLQDEVEAIASLQMEMTGGVLANVTASARAPYRTLVEVTGSDGVLIAENGLTVDRPVEMVLRRAGEIVETVTLENGDGYTRMLDSFALAFRGEGTFAASGEDGVRNMRGARCGVSSWRTGRREKL